MTFGSELDLVRSFATGVDRFPAAALSAGATRLLVIGHEVYLPGAGKGGGRGSVDLIAVDDRGEVWIIEAKLSRSPECAPEYVFANQLARYGQGLSRSEFSTMHGHFQDYAFGRRAVKPPQDLADAWREARSLGDMLDAWLRVGGKGGADTDATGLSRRVAARLKDGRFILAVLTDSNHPELIRWSERQTGTLETAVIALSDAGELRVCTRTPFQIYCENGVGQTSPPPFSRIPQSYEPLPRTLPYVLNPMAFRLYERVVVPRLLTLLGDIDQHRPKQSSTSFGYALPSKLGLPIFLRIGRNDERPHIGGAIAVAGQHALKVDFVLKWACDVIFQMSSDQAERRQSCVDSLWDLTSRLVVETGYKFKNQPRPLPLAGLVKEFQKGCSERTLLVERSGYGQGHAHEFGAQPGNEASDEAALTHVFELLEEHMPEERPVPVMRRPTRVRYKQGKLPIATCTPSPFL